MTIHFSHNHLKQLAIMTSMIGLFLSLLFWNSNILAGELSEQMKSKSKVLFTELEKNREIYTTDNQALAELVTKNLNDYFYYEYMGRFVAAKYWRKFNKTQQKTYLAEFKKLLLLTYANVVLNYSFNELTFKDEQPDRKKGRFWVKMLVNKNGKTTVIDFNIVKTKKGNKVINIKVEGVSLLINYRKSFGELLSKKTPDEFLQFLTDKNKSNLKNS